jgi:CRP-like cAMP-binding protein
MDIRDAIAASYLANGLTEDQLDRLASIAVLRSFQDGETIVEQDDSDRDLLVIARGSVDVLSVTGEVIGRARAGMPVGEISFIDARPRSVTVISHGASEVVVMPADPLWDLLNADRELALRALMNLSRLLCARLRATNRDLAALMAIEEAEPVRGRR